MDQFIRNDSSFPDCVVPAGGRSSRMGKWKLALPWGTGTGTVLGAVIDAASEAGCRVIVAGGYRYRRLRKLAGDRALVVRCRRWRRGMAATLARGLREVRTPMFFVTPADMPMIGPEDYRRLAESALTGPPAVRPAYGGRPGHPVLIGVRLIPLLSEAVSGPAPFRKALAGAGAVEVEWDSPRVAADLDTPEDYEAALRAYGGEGAAVPRS